jgi:putative membrane-bound dehydrogenase-like protein
MKKRLLVVILAVPCWASCTGETPDPAPVPPPPDVSPLDPVRARASFRIPPGFQIDLVASEPDIIDPVAMAFDEKGRLYVAEMPGYPNNDTAEGKASIPGRIRLLENPDEHHRYRKSTVFVTGLNFPSSVMPWKKGILVACAPDLIYFEDTGGGGHADVRRVLYTGFGRKLIESLVNSLQWGVDNWVYGLGSSNGGEIRSVERPELPAVSLHGRGFRFRPDVPGSLEPVLSGGQFGLAVDEWGRWFTCTNGEHLRHIVLEGRYPSREGYVPSPPALLDIPDHGAACKLYRASPFEAWRVERTTRRASSADTRARMPATELVPGGFVTSACGLTVLKGEVFVCDPANNVVHRDVLDPRGVSFVAHRAPGEADREFLASTDPWCRPVNLATGPDGALYVADFYREVIEGVSFIPVDIRAKLNLNVESGGRGRIWRVAPSDGRPPAKSDDWVRSLAHPEAWWRMTAQRMLVQDGHTESVPAIRELLAGTPSALGRLHALWTLAGLGALDAASIERALKDPEPGVREHAVRLSEGRLPTEDALLPLVEDPSPRVRFQLAFTLGECKQVLERQNALSALALRDGEDPYLRAAILSSAGPDPVGLDRGASGAPAAFTRDLAALIGARLQGPEIVWLLTRAARGGNEGGRVGTLAGLADGLRQRRQRNLPVPEARQALALLSADGSEAVRKAAAGLGGLIRTMSDEELAQAVQKARSAALEESRPLDERVEAARLLGSGGFGDVAPTLRELLGPSQPEPLQQAALLSLDAQSDPGVVTIIAGSWKRLTPSVRERALEVLTGRKDRLGPLLAAFEKGEIPPGELDGRRRAQLTTFPDREIAERAKKTFQEPPMDPRLFESFKDALDLGGDAARGSASFKKLCLTCHQARGEGRAVGPNLAIVRDNPPEQILKNILYPSLVIAPNFVQYVVETRDGQVLNGIIVEASSAALTLRRAGAEDAKLLRKDIRNLASSPVSLMPEDLLKGMSLQDVADLLQFVRETK